ncbi:hypothetical protein PC121_g13967 [Phytophthora cactorum]|nr:hypothetical protein PC121_g13967 [Phytophthora cactorum]
MASLKVSSAPQSTSGTGGFGTEMEYRRERDAQRRQDEVRREEQEQMRQERHEERERLREERFLALIAQIAKKQD